MKNIKNVGIIGLGYVGAPLAYLIASKGYSVVGIDNDINAIKKIKNRSNVPIQLQNEYIKKRKFDILATNDYSKLSNADVIIICIPTPTINSSPDLAILQAVVDKMSMYIKRNCLIIIESTVAQGMSKRYITDKLAEIGLEVNKYYDLAYCPERIDPGNKRLWVGNINRVCGGSSLRALKRAVTFYNTIIDAEIIEMNSIEEAELVKVWENSMRNISIAQANLLSIICDKYHFSVNRILKGLDSKVEQFGLSLAYPGIGVGGHCIPEDIHYLIETTQNDFKIDMELFEEAVKINENMPKYVYDKLLTRVKMNNEKIETMKVLMLGISYKPNLSDTRRSQALVLYNIIKQNTKNMKAYDPIAQANNMVLLSEDDLEEYINEAEIVIISCAHDIFLNIDYTKYKNIKYILDCWNKLDEEKIKKAGINYIGVGI